MLEETRAQPVHETNHSSTAGHKMAGMFCAHSDNMSEGYYKDLPENHPRRPPLQASHRFNAGDLIPLNNPLQQIYRDQDSIDFLRHILTVETLYSIADSRRCINRFV